MKLFIFGSTGDLIRRKVMRALQEVSIFNQDKLEIYALGRRDMDRREYHDFICSDWCNSNFKDSLHYVRVDFESLSLDNKLSREDTNYFYLSLPPSEYKRVLRYLDKVVEDNYDVKVLVEKPFGVDLEDARDLKDFVDNSGLKENLFVSDHYLFKRSFVNFPKDFKKVRIVSLEKVGLEGRASYYDSVGALRDMVQSHFLNLIFKNLGFEIDPERLEILDVLKGQYRGYLDELGKDSKAETFVYLKFKCCGKEFEFITGKGLYEKEGYVEIDDRRFDMRDDNSYVDIFMSFLSLDSEENMSGFPTMKDSILGWEVIEKFEEFCYKSKKEDIIYDKGSSLRDVIPDF